ncbi:hypothetical protein [Crossiella sp. CA198]|uniref:hypothetical protein n=1 Tax=Crossiella sp. CA198 TaxID=3455607 RepID=UPI003F8D2E8A
MTPTAKDSGFWRWLFLNPWARRIFYFPILPAAVLTATYLLLDWPHFSYPLVGAALSAFDVVNRYLDWRTLRRTGRLFLEREPRPDASAL